MSLSHLTINIKFVSPVAKVMICILTLEVTGERSFDTRIQLDCLGIQGTFTNQKDVLFKDIQIFIGTLQLISKTSKGKVILNTQSSKITITGEAHTSDVIHWRVDLSNVTKGKLLLTFKSDFSHLDKLIEQGRSFLENNEQ